MIEKPCDNPARYRVLPCVYRGRCNGAWEWARKAQCAKPIPAVCPWIENVRTWWRKNRREK